MDNLKHVMSTRSVAFILGVRPGTLSKAIWSGSIPAPVKGPGGAFLWTSEDFTRAQRYFKRRRLEVIL